MPEHTQPLCFFNHFHAVKVQTVKAMKLHAPSSVYVFVLYS